MTVKETLIAARALIDTPERWCQHTGEDRDGRICSSTALTKAGAPGMGAPAYRALSQAMDNALVCEFNDSHTHAEVMAAFDRAIATAS